MYIQIGYDIAIFTTATNDTAPIYIQTGSETSFPRQFVSAWCSGWNHKSFYRRMIWRPNDEKKSLPDFHPTEPHWPLNWRENIITTSSVETNEENASGENSLCSGPSTCHIKFTANILPISHNMETNHWVLSRRFMTKNHDYVDSFILYIGAQHNSYDMHKYRHGCDWASLMSSRSTSTF